MTRLPLSAFPRLHIACRNTMDDRHFSTAYKGHYSTLHFCEYEGLMRIGRDEFAVKPGDVTLTAAGKTRSYNLRKPGTHLLLAFTTGKVTGDGSLRIPHHLSLGRAAALAEMRFLETIQLHARGVNDPLAAMQSRVMLQELFIWLAIQARGDVAAGGSALDRALNETIERIDRQYERALTIPALARQAGLSQNYLARRFRQRYGMTIQRYLLTRRMKHAHELLVSTSLPVKTIGARVGVADPQHFNKQFRAIIGLSPTDVRSK